MRANEDQGTGLRPIDGGTVNLCSGLEPGAHIVTPRTGYTHHGIYVGDGKVIHYGGLAYGMHRGPVEVVTLAAFADGRALWVSLEQRPRFAQVEIVRRAYSRVGENTYRLLTNNCEHFCEWCVRGQHRSQQVDSWLKRLLRSRPIKALARLGTVAKGGHQIRARVLQE